MYDSGALPEIEHPFAAERSLWEIEALLEGHEFDNIDQANERLRELIQHGKISEIAGAWKQDDPVWRAQRLAYDAMESNDAKETLWLIQEALKLDPDCTDALRLMVTVVPMDLDKRITLMRDVVERAEQRLGEEFFEREMGHFWGMVATRPYMRAMQHLGELLTEAGELEAATATLEKMLELNPRDNQGIRYLLLGLYLAANQPAQAAGLMSQYPDEEEIAPAFAWGRVLERWLAGELAEAEEALRRARQVNRFVELYLVGTRKAPSEPPPYYRPGDDLEAQACAVDLAAAWKSHPAFVEWSRAHGR